MVTTASPAVMVFLGAFLLFCLEPLVGRLLVPYFGGAAHVWLICLMFYQAALLAGYLYAHFVAERIGRWHLAVVLLPLVSLPPHMNGALLSNPTPFALVAVLVSRVALVCVVLSASTVVAQTWLSRSSALRGRDPYPLYAVSNAGSLAGLLAYPFVFEPLLGVTVQTYGWMAFYLLYILFAVIAWFSLRPPAGGHRQGEATGETPAPPGPSPADYGRWTVLSAVPSMFLLTVTNFVSMEAGPFPMVWVIPLAIYLVSFIIPFRRKDPTGFRAFGSLWPEAILVGLFLYLLKSPHPLFMAGHLAVLFCLCLHANVLLHSLRPPAAFLTSFYLCIAAGGFLGGAAAGIGAPLVFNGLFEYPLALAAFAAIFWGLSGGKFLGFWRDAHFGLLAARVATGLVIIVFLGMAVQTSLASAERFRSRNFYGISRVVDDRPYAPAPITIRMLISGCTAHGVQFLDGEKQGHPTLYYSAKGGLGAVFALLPSPARVGAIGLGIGTAGAYLRPGDSIVYYELNPHIDHIARRWFSYLRETKGSWKVVIADGRVALQGLPPGDRYDLIFVDAFTGDGVPSHLLTREALAIYLDRLRAGGVILLHLTNRYYDFRPVVKATALGLGLAGAMNVPAEPDPEYCEARADYIALSREPARIDGLVARGWIRLGESDRLARARAWTDDYVNILGPLAAKYFRPGG